MASSLHLLLARARAHELRLAAGSPVGSRDWVDDAALPATTPVTLRFAFPDDTRALARLAALDSAEPPALPALLCEAGGQLLAALSLVDGSVVADPFHPTVALVELLRARARQLRGTTPRRRRAVAPGVIRWRSAWRLIAR
jgi:hypothetical protein